HLFKAEKYGQQPNVILTISVICAETDELAEEIALSSLVWSLQKAKGEGKYGVPSIQEAKAYMLDRSEKTALQEMKQKMIIGNPHTVSAKLEALQTQYKADELMLVTITHSPEDRRKSYQLIAEELMEN